MCDNCYLRFDTKLTYYHNYVTTDNSDQRYNKL